MNKQKIYNINPSEALGSESMGKQINWIKVKESMQEEQDDNFCCKCLVCGIVLSSSVQDHLDKHKRGLK